MGTVTKRQGKKRPGEDGVSFRAQVSIKGHREGKTFKDKIDAMKWIRDKEAAIRSGIPMDGELAQGDMLFHKAMDNFIIESRRVVSRAQIKSYENSRLILSKTFGPTISMAAISRADVSAHMLKRLTVDDVGPSSIRNELSFIRGVYTKAIEWGVNIPSPELAIKRPKAKMRSREDRLDNILKPGEIEDIFIRAERSRNNLYQYLTFLLYTGMRPSEAATLYWERLPKKKEVQAEKERQPVGFVDLDRGGFSRVGTKTEKRFVPAHPKAIEVIENLRKEAKEGKKLVFLDDKYIGRDMAYKFYRRSFQTVCSNAQDGEEDLRAGINFYSFRHTFRSRLEECGVSTAFAETIIGHSERSFKYTYIHLSDEALVNAVGLLSYDVEI